MLKKVFVTSVLLILLTTGCQHEAEGLVSGDTVTIRPEGAYAIYSQKAPINAYKAGEVTGGTTVEILEMENDWVRVKNNNIEGWIPIWYFSDGDPTPVIDVDYNYSVFNRNSYGFLYPHGPETIQLQIGKLLKPVQEWGEWVKVSIITYESTAVEQAWIMKSYLSPVGVIEPVEGILEAGAEAYHVEEYFEEVYTMDPEKVVNDTGVLILDKRDEYLFVRGSGGLEYWVKSENVKFRAIAKPE